MTHDIVTQNIKSVLETLLKLSNMHKNTNKEIADFTLNAAVEMANCEMGFLGFISEDEKVMNIHAWSKNAMAQCAMNEKPIEFPIDQAGLWGEPIRQRRAIIVNNYIAPNPYKKGYPEGHVKIEKFAGIPIFDEEKIVAIIAIANRAEDFRKEDMDELNLLCKIMWTVIKTKQITQLLENQKRDFQIVADYTADWEMWTDPQDNIRYISPSCYKITGYYPEDFYGNPYLRTSIIHPNDLPLWDKHLKEYGHQISNPSIHLITFRIVHKNGKEIWIEHECTPVFDDKGVYLGIRQSNRDITSRVLAELEIRQLKNLLPICSVCKKIRNDKGYWENVEDYFRTNSEIYSHFTIGFLKV